jgi:hypothetical protein
MVAGELLPNTRKTSLCFSRLPQPVQRVVQLIIMKVMNLHWAASAQLEGGAVCVLMPSPR